MSCAVFVVRPPARHAGFVVLGRYRSQRIPLFLLTVVYLPVSREVLTQFSSQYDTAALAGCAHVDRDGIPCCLREFPSEPCFLAPGAPALTLLQILAAVAVPLLVLGIPAFFIFLIERGIGELDMAGYQDAANRVHADIAALRAHASRAAAPLVKADIAALVKEKRAFLGRYYFERLLFQRKPQSYLFVPFSRRMRYMKVLQVCAIRALQRAWARLCV